jgi:hypothetical protein
MIKLNNLMVRDLGRMHEILGLILTGSIVKKKIILND